MFNVKYLGVILSKPTTFNPQGVLVLNSHYRATVLYIVLDCPTKVKQIGGVETFKYMTEHTLTFASVRVPLHAGLLFH